MYEGGRFGEEAAPIFEIFAQVDCVVKQVGKFEHSDVTRPPELATEDKHEG